MSVYVPEVWRVACDAVGCHAEIEPTNAESSQDARRIARSNGWGRRATLDYCPVHATKALKEGE